MMRVLVTGASGTQGGAVVTALLNAGHTVHALSRNPTRLSADTFYVAQGDLDDPASLVRAMQGVDAVFSVQPAPYLNPNSERQQAGALIDAAKVAGVRHFIHTSVSGTMLADRRELPSQQNYWLSKVDVEAMVRAAGFPVWTILRPAWMMDNFIPPKAAFLLPDLVNNEIVTACAPDTKIAFVAADDVGQAAVAALAKPERFHRAEIELAGDVLTFAEAATIAGAKWGRTISVKTLTPDELVARGQNPGWVDTQAWLNAVGYPARPKHMAAFGLSPTRFADWIKTHGCSHQSLCARGDGRSRNPL